MNACGPSTVTHDEYLARRYVPALDGLRAFSVLIVVTVHMHDRIWGWLAGELGVTVFFVLSGYLITMLALREEASRGSLCLSAFCVRRCFRILPLYYVILGVYCLLILGLGVPGGRRDPLLSNLYYYLFYCQEIPYYLGGGAGMPFYQSWSLGIEEKFYLVWPLLAFVLWKGRDTLRFGGAVLLAALFAVMPTFGPAGWCLYSYYPILAGCIVALLLNSRSSYDRLRVAGPKATWIAAGFLAVHFSVPHAPWLEFAYPVAAATLLVGVVTGNTRLTQLLGWRPFARLGTLSYGIYLDHILCLSAAEKVFASGSGDPRISACALLLAVALATGVAFVLHRVIERPCIRAGRELSGRLMRPETASAREAASRP